MKLKCFLAAVCCACLLPVTTASAQVTVVENTVGVGYAVTDDYTLWRWSYTTEENGVKTSHRTPEAVLDRVRSVADDTGGLLVVKTDGTLWMSRSDGTFGNVAENVAQAKRFGDGFLALDTDGVLWQYVSGADGYAGKALLTRVTSFACSLQSAYAIREDGGLWVFGQNELGQLGTGDTADVETPRLVFSGAKAVAVDGSASAWVLRDGGGLYMTGRLSEKYTGQTLTFVTNQVQAVYASPAGNGVAYRMDDNSLWGAGNDHLTMGNAAKGFVKLLEDVADFYPSATNAFYLAKKTDGGLYSWGTAFHGDGTTGASDAPVRVASGVVAAAAAANTATVLFSDGRLFTWGEERNGVGPGFVGAADTLSPTRLLNQVLAPWKETVGVSQAQSGVLVTYEGATLAFDQDPVIVNGRTLVPLRAIFEAMGASVSWQSERQTITAVRGDVTVKLAVGESVLWRNGESFALDTAAVIVGGRTMIPARAVAEAFGAAVTWDADSRTMAIQEKE